MVSNPLQTSPQSSVNGHHRQRHHQDSSRQNVKSALTSCLANQIAQTKRIVPLTTLLDVFGDDARIPRAARRK